VTATTDRPRNLETGEERDGDTQGVMPTRPRVESGGGLVVLRSLDGGGDMRDELGVADVMELEGLIADRCGTISAEVSVAVEWMDIRVFSNALDAERLCAT
jgi:hypothetical protein